MAEGLWGIGSLVQDLTRRLRGFKTTNRCCKKLRGFGGPVESERDVRGLRGLEVVGFVLCGGVRVSVDLQELHGSRPQGLRRFRIQGLGAVEFETFAFSVVAAVAMINFAIICCWWQQWWSPPVMFTDCSRCDDGLYNGGGAGLPAT